MKRPFKFRRRKTVPGIARELLRGFEDERRWTRGHYARDSAGMGISVREPGACQWCVMGAAIATGHDADAVSAFRDSFKSVAGEWPATINDRHDGLPAVRRVLRKLAKG